MADWIRANGIIVLLAFLCVDLLSVAGRIWKKNRPLSWAAKFVPFRDPLIHLLVYAVFCLFAGVIYSIVPDTATSASSIVIRRPLFIHNIAYYTDLLQNFFASLAPYGMFQGVTAYITVPLFVLGIAKLFRKELLSLVFAFGTMLLLMIINMRQELRYAFPALPVIVLLLTAGAGCVTEGLFSHVKKPEWLRATAWIVVGAFCAILLFGRAEGAIENMRSDRAPKGCAYSADALDCYDYIKSNTSDDAVIVFFKPATLALNTGRVCVGSTEALPKDDIPAYLLITSVESKDYYSYDTPADVQAAYKDPLTLIYENPSLWLFAIERVGTVQ